MTSKTYRFIKRGFDIIAAFLGIAITLPIWVIAIAGILVSDIGPIFYVARRVGKDNKEFPMLKFRTMRVGKANEHVFRGEEERIFPFGKFIRNTKIDELPQLICCLVGDMSIIGPRPAAKDQVGDMRSGKYAAVADIKPGLSGPAAIYDYIYGDTIESEEEYRQKVLPTRLELELYYVNHRSAGYDIKLIWYTVICVFASIFGISTEKIQNELTACVADNIIHEEREPEIARV